jgi:hypothetical protein
MHTDLRADLTKRYSSEIADREEQKLIEDL